MTNATEQTSFVFENVCLQFALLKHDVQNVFDKIDDLNYIFRENDHEWFCRYVHDINITEIKVSCFIKAYSCDSEHPSDITFVLEVTRYSGGELDMFSYYDLYKLLHNNFHPLDQLPLTTKQRLDVFETSMSEEILHGIISTQLHDITNAMSSNLKYTDHKMMMLHQLYFGVKNKMLLKVIVEQQSNDFYNTVLSLLAMFLQDKDAEIFEAGVLLTGFIFDNVPKEHKKRLIHVPGIQNKLLRLVFYQAISDEEEYKIFRQHMKAAHIILESIENRFIQTKLKLKEYLHWKV